MPTACGDVEPVALGAFQRGQGAGGGDLVGVIARAGHFQQRDVAVQPHALGHRRHGGQAAQRGEFAGGDRGPRLSPGSCGWAMTSAPSARA